MTPRYGSPILSILLTPNGWIWTRPGHSGAAIDFSLKKSDQSKLSIFYFKNFSRGVSVLQNSCCRRWPGLLRVCKVRWCTFTCKLKHGLNVFIYKIFFLFVGFLSCVDTCFFRFVCAQLVVRSFCLVHFWILLHVWIYVLHNHLFINLFDDVISMFVCVFPCLPYFFLSYLVMLNWVF